MVSIGDLQELVSQWTERMGNTIHPLPYRDALNECIYELNTILTKAIEEEYDDQQALAEDAADKYLASMEAYEDVI